MADLPPPPGPHPPAPSAAPTEATLTITGGRTVRISEPTKGWPQRVCLEIQSPGHPPFVEGSWLLGSMASRRALAGASLISDVDVQQIEAAAIAWVGQVLDARERERLTAASATQDAQIEVRRRTMQQRPADALVYPIRPLQITDLLRQGVEPETVLEWDDGDALAVLDIDFHAGQRPLFADLERLRTTLSPTPLATWTTQGGGIHAVYVAIEPFTARELAAAASALVATDHVVVAMRGKTEIISRTRHPGGVQKNGRCGPVHEHVPDTVLACLYEFSAAGCSDDERTDTLEHFGYQLGQRLSHDHCRISPGHRSSSPAPVVVTERGLWCYSCASNVGRGLASWGEIRRREGLPTGLVDETAPILDAVEHFAHGTHVSYLFDVCAPRFDRAHHETLYRCLLKRRHGTDPRIPLCFNNFPFVRGDGMWLHADTLKIVAPKPAGGAFNACPSVKFLGVDEAGDVVLANDVNRVNAHSSDGTVFGYAPLQGYSRSPIYYVHNRSRRSDGLYRVQARSTRGDRLRYVGLAQRMPWSECTQAIAERFPGITLNYLALIHAARGCGEEGTSQLPIIWANAPSEHAKTATAFVECALYDESPVDLAGKDARQLDDAFGEAQGQTGVVMFDDFAKVEDKDGERLSALLSFLLRAARRIQFWKRHVGHISIPVTTPIVLTELKRPEAFMQSEQLGRRVVMVPLRTRATGWGARGGILGWWRENEDLRAAAEGWHSHIVDWFFPEGVTPNFSTIARTLGFPFLSDFLQTHDIGAGKESTAREFFQGVLVAPAVPEALTAKLGRGWKEVMPGDDRSPLGKAATMLVNMLGRESVNELSLRAALEPFTGRWHTMVPIEVPAQFEIRKHGSKILVRFREDNANARRFRLNEQLLGYGATPETMLHYGEG